MINRSFVRWLEANNEIGDGQAGFREGVGIYGRDDCDTEQIILDKELST
jgi:hypothetical protein